MNNLDLSVALATAPSSAFADLRERPRFWFPLLLVMLSTAGMAFWYYSIVDIEWFKEAMFGIGTMTRGLFDRIDSPMPSEIRDPLKVQRSLGSRLLDSLGWRPLST